MEEIESYRSPEIISGVDRAHFKFLAKAWRDYAEPLDVSDLPKEEAKKLAESNEQTRQLLITELQKLQNKLSEEQKQQLDAEALAEQLQGWRDLLAGRPEEEIEQVLERIRTKFNSIKI